MVSTGLVDLDAGMLGEGETLEADVCVVGAGPAGIVVACEIAASGRDVLLLESGGFEREPSASALNRGRSRGDRYAGLRATRERAVGGTARIWNTPVHGEAGAKYVPLDPVDLGRAPASGGWPLDWEELVPWYRCAQATCGLGPFDYEAGAWSSGSDLLDLAGTGLASRVYQLGAARAVTGALLDEARAAGSLRLCTHATVLRLVPDGEGDVEQAEACGSSGRRFRVRARTFVLAGGAVENARLLLLSRSPAAPEGLGNGSGWVGRCFMEHPRDHTLLLVPSVRLAAFAFYDVHATSSGTVVAGRLALAEAALADEALPNASLTFVPRPRRSWLAARTARGGRYPPGRAAWSAHEGFEARFDAFHLLLNVEQRPHPENRVTLGRRRDRFGAPRVELDWHWTPEDEARLRRLHAFVTEALESAGLGRVEAARGLRLDPNAHHHAGTTRMSADPASGVVDATGRVHGTENVYVAGASVFPTAGFANPTLTIVALAHRLGAHLGAAGGR